jgi:glycosyltransferase involved in cell wall biosynthesis
MNILMVTPEYPPRNLGGGGVVYRNLARELKKQGYIVTVLAGNFYNRKLVGKVECTHDEGVGIFFLPLMPAPKIGNMSIATCTPPTLSAIIFLVRELIRNHSDVIHLHGVGHSLIDITGLLCILLHRRYVLTCHGIPKSPKMAGSVFRWIFKAYLNIFEKFIIRKARALTTVSYALLKECRGKNLTNTNMVVIPNGPNLDLGKVNPDVIEKIEEKYSLKDRKLIFSIGRLAQVKGFQYLVGAMPYVISEAPDALAVIAGYGPYEPTLKDLVNTKNLSDHVKLIGWITEEEKTALYQRADIVVFPSLYEPFGIVLLEAIAMRKPVIAFNKPPMSEIIDNETNGLLIPLGDVKELARAILRVLSNIKLRERLASNTYGNTQAFRWENIARKYADLCLEVCGRRQRDMPSSD